MNSSMRRGSWLSLTAERDGSGQYRGHLDSVFLPRLQLTCRVSDPQIDCELRQHGKRLAALRAVRGDAQAATGSLASQIEAALRAHHYQPRQLDQPPWLQAMRTPEKRPAKARDDLDVLATWQHATARVPDSHLALLRPQPLTPSASTPPIQLDWREDDVAVLHIAPAARGAALRR